MSFRQLYTGTSLPYVAAGQYRSAFNYKNAFVNYDRKTKTYQTHNIFTNFLKDMLERSNLKQEVYWRTAGWYLKTGDNFEAMHYFYVCKDFDQLLFALEQNKANGLNNENRKELFLKYFEECPDDVKGKHHFALLIFAMAFISYKELVLFGKACIEFHRNIQRDESLNDDFRRQILGEYELLLSFTGYNDINKMSEHHQKASRLLCKPTSFIDLRANWTFGALSVYTTYKASAEQMIKENFSFRGKA